MMNKQIILAVLCSAGLLSGCNQSTEQTTAVAANDSQRSATLPAKTESDAADMDVNTLLTVNGKPVTRAMYSLYFQDRMRGVPDAKTSAEMQMGVLNELANILIVSQAAEEAGLAKREDVSASLELLKAKLLTQVAIQEHATKHQPTDEEIQQIYDAEYASQSNTEYKARHILVKEEEEAKKLITELDGGSDFAELAKQHSTGPTGKDGGDLGWFDAAQMVEPFAQALTGMEKGKYSAAPGGAAIWVDGTAGMMAQYLSINYDGVDVDQHLIMDFNRGIINIVNTTDGTCSRAQIDSPPDSCIPDNATYTDIYFGMGNQQVKAKSSMIDHGTYQIYMTVTADTCFPITEDVIGTIDNRQVIERFVFVNITAGISDRSVFSVPASCNGAVVGPKIPLLGRRSVFR